MTKSGIITTLSIVAVCAILATLFYLMGRGPQEIAPQPKPMETQNTELKIEVLAEGAGIEIKNGQVASVYYRGTLADATVFDQNNSGEGFSFPLGAGRVIQGWDIGVLGMKVGEKRKLTIPANLGYGQAGFPGVIPPNATLIFEVELRAIK